MSRADWSLVPLALIAALPPACRLSLVVTSDPTGRVRLVVGVVTRRYPLARVWRTAGGG